MFLDEENPSTTYLLFLHNECPGLCRKDNLKKSSMFRHDDLLRNTIINFFLQLMIGIFVHPKFWSFEEFTVLDNVCYLAKNV